MFSKLLPTIVLFILHHYSKFRCAAANIEPSPLLHSRVTGYDSTNFPHEKNVSASFYLESANATGGHGKAHNCTLRGGKINCTRNVSRAFECSTKSAVEDVNEFTRTLMGYEIVELSTFSFCVPFTVLVGLQTLLVVRSMVILLFLTHVFWASVLYMSTPGSVQSTNRWLILIPPVLPLIALLLSAWLFFLSSNFVSRRIKSFVHVCNFRTVEIRNANRNTLLILVSTSVLLFITMSTEFISVLLRQKSEAAGEKKILNQLSFGHIIFYLLLLCLIILAMDRLSKTVATRLPPNLNFHFFIAYLIMVFIWIFGVIILLHEIWVLWVTFFIINTVKPVLFIVIAGYLEHRNQKYECPSLSKKDFASSRAV